MSESRLGPTALGDLDRLGRQLARCGDAELAVVDDTVHVESVHLCGSFARGEARCVFSDLDVRLVCSAWVGAPAAEQIQRRLRCGVGPWLTPQRAGYLDAQLGTRRPSTPSLELYTCSDSEY